RRIDTAAGRTVAPAGRSRIQLVQPAREKTALRLQPGQLEGTLERSTRVSHATESATQLRTGRVQQMVILEVAPIADALDERQPGRRTVTHGDGNRTVQLDHR